MPSLISRFLAEVPVPPTVQAVCGWATELSTAPLTLPAPLLEAGGTPRAEAHPPSWSPLAGLEGGAVCKA